MRLERFLKICIYGLLIFLEACCTPEDTPENYKTLTRFLRLKDTTDVINEIRYKQSDIILHPGTNQSKFPVSESTTTTAYIKRQNKNNFDTLEITPHFILQHIENECKGDRIRRTNPEFSITYHTLKEVNIVGMDDQNKRYEVFIID